MESLKVSIIQESVEKMEKLDREVKESEQRVVKLIESFIEENQKINEKLNKT